jgi:hypothetical protein
VGEGLACSQTCPAPMRSPYSDRAALVTALVGAGLMVLTLAWRVNPAESSVMPGFLSGSPLGGAVVWVLLCTCMPVWIPVVWLTALIPLAAPAQYVVAGAVMVILQGLLYFAIGKLVSWCVQRVARRTSSSQGSSSRR